MNRVSVIYTVNKSPAQDRIEVKVNGESVFYDEIDQIRLRFQKQHGVSSGCYVVAYLESEGDTWKKLI